MNTLCPIYTLKPIDSFFITSEEPPLDKFDIEFKDGLKYRYEKEILMKFEFFKSSTLYKEHEQRNYKLKEFTKEDLDVAIGLVIENKTLFDILSDESWKDPYLYENIENILKFFHTGDSQKVTECILKRITDSELPIMPFEAAMWIIDNFSCKVKAKLYECAIKIVKKIIYCKNLDEAVANYNADRKQRLELYHTLKALNQLEAKKNKNFLDLEALNTCKRVVEMLKYLTSNKQEDEKTPHECSNAIKYLTHPNESIRKRAGKAVQFFRTQIITQLTQSHADTTRVDLLDHLVGPKNYLYKHYNLFEQKIDLELNNLSPYEMENEIRSNLSGELPTRIITNEESSFIPFQKITHRVQTLVPQIKNWKYLNQEELLKLKLEIKKINSHVDCSKLEFQSQSNKCVQILVDNLKGTLFFRNLKIYMDPNNDY